MICFGGSSPRAGVHCFVPLSEMQKAMEKCGAGYIAPVISWEAKRERGKNQGPQPPLRARPQSPKGLLLGLTP